MMKLDRLHLRLRILLFFVFMTLGGLGIFGTGLWLGSQREQDGFLFAEIIGGFGFLGLMTWIWYLFDENLAKPMQWLAGALTARAHTDIEEELDPKTARYLGDLAPAAREVTRHLAQTRNALAETVAQETTRLINEKQQLVAMAADVPFGVVLCSGTHKIAFYNSVAAEMLDEDHHHPGLDHSLFDFLEPEPILDAYNRLCAYGQGPDMVIPTLVTTVLGHRTLSARMRLTHAADESDVTPGYVMSIDDVTNDLAVVGQSTALLTRVFADLRPHMASLRTAIEFRKRDAALGADPEMTEGLIDGLDAMLHSIGEHFAEYDSSRGSLWPMEDVSARQIVNAVKSRLDINDLTVEGPDATRLHVGALPIIVLLAHLCDRVVNQHGGRVPSLIVADEDDCPMIAVGWSGDALPFDTMSQWLDEPLDFGVPGVTGRSVLRIHATDCWPEFGRFGRSVLKIPLPHLAGRKLPSMQRGVEYDFDLMQKTPPAKLTKAKLSDLTFVVFDTETTGLLPSQGDEICQIAALRVVNGRIVEGEQINRLVNPERPIPVRSTEVHGITDEMVENAPTIEVVGAQFHSFARGSILVAHNAPFDLEFLRRHEAGIGKAFTNPVLDTVLLSAIVFGQDAEHTLDAICQRLGIVIPPEQRHTAMGDTIATAHAFIKMTAMCEARGIETFGDVIAEGRKHKRLIQDLNTDLEI